jgi:hypothetical protein
MLIDTLSVESLRNLQYHYVIVADNLISTAENSDVENAESIFNYYMEMIDTVTQAINRKNANDENH